MPFALMFTGRNKFREDIVLPFPGALFSRSPEEPARFASARQPAVIVLRCRPRLLFSRPRNASCAPRFLSRSAQLVPGIYVFFVLDLGRVALSDTAKKFASAAKGAAAATVAVALSNWVARKSLFPTRGYTYIFPRLCHT